VIPVTVAVAETPVEEAATVAAVAPRLDDGQTSVGTAVHLEHRRASPPGAELVVEAELTEIDGPRLVFMFIARGAYTGQDDEGEVIGAGTLERVVVARGRFLTRLAGPPLA